MTRGLRVFIVEDDPVIASRVEAALARWGCEARRARDFERVDAECAAFDAQLVLLDVTLPYFNGFFWCAEIRKRSRVPIIFLSSRAESMDIVMGIQMGGDDYVTKPFSMEVLMAKITAVLRRAAPEQTGRALLGRAELCEAEGCIRLDEQSVQLTRNEQRLLSLLIQHKGAVVSREKLIMHLWDSDSFIDDNTLTVNMNRLRKRLAELGLDGCVETRKGQGYCLTDP